MKPSFPSRTWFEDSDNFRDWSELVNLKFVSQAALLVAGGDGVDPVVLTEALNQTIVEYVAAFASEGVPDAIIAAFKKQYGLIHHDKLLDSVCALAVTMASARRQAPSARPSSGC